MSIDARSVELQEALTIAIGNTTVISYNHHLGPAEVERMKRKLRSQNLSACCQTCCWPEYHRTRYTQVFADRSFFASWWFVGESCATFSYCISCCTWVAMRTFCYYNVVHKQILFDPVHFLFAAQILFIKLPLNGCPPISPNPKSPNPEMQLSVGKIHTPYLQLHFYPEVFQISKFWAFPTLLVCRIRS